MTPGCDVVVVCKTLEQQTDIRVLTNEIKNKNKNYANNIVTILLHSL